MDINGKEFIGDDFYENIEAPKFVDLTAPDRFRSSHDDRYWFCLRVGCDQKHEEEMDSEEIYKNFVLRVMAARSPNIRLQKALCRKDSSTSVKCPLTVPAKSSKSRISRIALVSSVPKKIVDGNGKVKAGPLFKESVTPDVKLKEKKSSVVAKSMTTPRNKKPLSNAGTFRSVRNPKTSSVAAPKDRVVAKTLVFHSPKKTVKIKTSMELSGRMKALCTGMKKLEITGKKKQEAGHGTPLDAPKKQVRCREVKSRVYDSLQRSKSCQSKVAKSSKCLKINTMQKEVKQAGAEGNEIEEKCGNGVLEVCSTSDGSRSDERNEKDEECMVVSIINSFTPLNNISSASNCEEKNHQEDSDLSGENNEISKGTDIDSEEKENLSSQDNEIMNEDDKENATSTNDNKTENASADKENNSSPDDNRELNLNSSQTGRKKIIRKQETCKNIQTVSKGMGKISKGNSAAGVTCAEGINYRRPKLTNPKPFRLRTDERQILKEANLEKRLHSHEPSKETSLLAARVVLEGSSHRKVKKAVHGSESCLQQVEHDERGESNSEKATPKTESVRARVKPSPLTSKGSSGHKRSTPKQKCTGSMHRKTKQQKLGLDKTASKSESASETTKSLFTKQSTLTQGTESSKKKTASIRTPGGLGIIKESSPTTILTRKLGPVGSLENGASSNKSAAALSRSSSTGRRRLTVPKEPHFNDAHRPKSCARRE